MKRRSDAARKPCSAAILARHSRDVDSHVHSERSDFVKRTPVAGVTAEAPEAHASECGAQHASVWFEGDRIRWSERFDTLRRGSAHASTAANSRAKTTRCSRFLFVNRPDHSTFAREQVMQFLQDRLKGRFGGPNT